MRVPSSELSRTLRQTIHKPLNVPYKKVAKPSSNTDDHQSHVKFAVGSNQSDMEKEQMSRTIRVDDNQSHLRKRKTFQVSSPKLSSPLDFRDNSPRLSFSKKQRSKGIRSNSEDEDRFQRESSTNDPQPAGQLLLQSGIDRI